MEQRNRQRRPRPAAGQKSGFTLIETVVVIVVLGVITAMVAVNWASFIRHQELRQDAITLHKEIMALKARAIENGDTVTLRAPSVNSNSYIIRWTALTPAGDSVIPVPAHKDFQLNKGVIIDTGFNIAGESGISSSVASSELKALAKNGWHSTNGPAGTVGAVKIWVKPDNINAYDSVFTTGRVVVRSESEKVKARYCIQKDSVNIRPELYYQSKPGGAWTRM